MSESKVATTVTAEEQALLDAKQAMQEIAMAIVLAMGSAPSNEEMFDVLTHSLITMYRWGGRDMKVVMAERLAGVPGQVVH
jgi:predicted aconitase